MNYSGKDVLVTGAGGFIGSNLVDALIEKKANVTALVHYNSRNDWGMINHYSSNKPGNLAVILGDLRDKSLIQNIVDGKDTVFHLGALIGIPYSYSAPESYIDVNIRGTFNILEASKKADVEHIVHTSTSEVYGTAVYSPINENHPLQGQSPYSASKIAADKLAESYYCSFNLPVSTIRPFNSYGPRQSARAIIPTIISQALTNKTVKIGSLNPIRDLTFVSDTIEGFLKIGENENTIGQVINVGSGKGITIGDLAKKIIDLIDPGIEIVTDAQRIRPSHSEVGKLLCDNSKAANLVNWEPHISLDEGLFRTIDYIKKNLTDYKPNTYTV